MISTNLISICGFFLLGFCTELSFAYKFHYSSVLKRTYVKKIDVLNLNKNNHIASTESSITKKIISTITACLIISQSPITTLAAVGEGDLPPGAMAFSKILKYQGEWKKLYNTIETRQAEISDTEVQSIKLFLKQLANEYGDLELLGNGIPDKAVSDQARAIAKEFRKEIRQCDDAASDKDFKKIIEIYPKSAKLLDDFLSLLQDVPDEL